MRHVDSDYDYYSLKEDYSLTIKDNRAYLVSPIVELPLHMSVAGSLSLFNGKRTQKEIEEMVSKIFKYNKSEAQVYFASLKQRFGVFMDKRPNNGELELEPLSFFRTAQNYDIPEHYPAPVVMNINLTFNCNRRCKYCYMNANYSNDIESDAVKPERMLEIINEAADIGVSKIVFIGGEPFLNQHLLSYLQLCSNRGINSQVTTKSYLSEKTLDELAKLNNFSLYLSIDSNMEYINTFLTGDAYFHYQIMDTLKGALERNIHITVAPVLCSVNLPFFKEFILYLEELGVKDVYVSRFFRSKGRYIEDFEITDEQWKMIKKELIDYKHMIRFSGESTNPIIDAFSNKKGVNIKKRCAQGRTDMTVLPNGAVTYCGFIVNTQEYLSYGNINDNSIMEIWNSNGLLKVLYPSRDKYIGEKCYDCENFDSCRKKMECVNSSLIYKNRLFSPISDCCSGYAKIRE